jgi:hypothetical protein
MVDMDGLPEKRSSVALRELLYLLDHALLRREAPCVAYDQSRGGLEMDKLRQKLRGPGALVHLVGDGVAVALLRVCERRGRDALHLGIPEQHVLRMQEKSPHGCCRPFDEDVVYQFHKGSYPRPPGPGPTITLNPFLIIIRNETPTGEFLS